MKEEKVKVDFKIDEFNWYLRDLKTSLERGFITKGEALDFLNELDLSQYVRLTIN